MDNIVIENLQIINANNSRLLMNNACLKERTFCNHNSSVGHILLFPNDAD
jgi:hypothetical protein